MGIYHFQNYLVLPRISPLNYLQYSTFAVSQRFLVRPLFNRTHRTRFNQQDLRRKTNTFTAAK